MIFGFGTRFPGLGSDFSHRDCQNRARKSSRSCSNPEEIVFFFLVLVYIHCVKFSAPTKAAHSMRARIIVIHHDFLYEIPYVRSRLLGGFGMLKARCHISKLNNRNFAAKFPSTRNVRFACLDTWCHLFPKFRSAGPPQKRFAVFFNS